MAESNIKIYDLHRFSTIDGNGIRTVVFLKGCPLRCIWCHNPESQDHQTELLYYETNCIKCGSCVQICSRRALSLNETIEIDRSKCTLCLDCVDKCPRGALKAAGYETTTSELLKEILKDKKYFDLSGGGVTLSGGEPILQHDQLHNLVIKMRRAGVSVDIETCLYCDLEGAKSFLNELDTIYCDVKIIDSDRHKIITGVDNRIIKENISQLMNEGFNVKIRYPIVPQVNDSEDDLLQLVQFLKGNSCNEVEIIPYHDFGINKYQALDRNYTLKDTKSHSQSKINDIKIFFENHGIVASITFL